MDHCIVPLLDEHSSPARRRPEVRRGDHPDAHAVVQHAQLKLRALAYLGEGGGGVSAKGGGVLLAAVRVRASLLGWAHEGVRSAGG